MKKDILLALVLIQKWKNNIESQAEIRITDLAIEILCENFDLDLKMTLMDEETIKVLIEKNQI